MHITHYRIHIGIGYIELDTAVYSSSIMMIILLECMVGRDGLPVF